MFHHASITHHITNVLSFLPVHERNSQAQSRPCNVFQTLFRESEFPSQRSLPPIFAALEILETYPLLRAVLATFPPSIHYAIKASLLTSDPYQGLRLQVLERLADKYNGLDSVVEEADPMPLPFLLQHECVFGVIEGMLADSKQYRRELAFLFTQLSVSRLPQHLQPRMATSSATLPLTVLPTYSEWYLCSSAEDRLSRAMRDQAVLLVNGVILLKFYGKLSGLALQTTLLADGTQLIEGCWYAPIDQREEIRTAFDRGESRLCVEGQWTLIRALSDDSKETLLQEVQTYAAALPEQLPHQIQGMTRRTYRCENREGF